MRSSSRRLSTDIARRELIGLSVTVHSRSAGHDGLEGLVVDETKHTFLVELANGACKRVPKSGNRFVFRVGMDAAEVVGDDIQFRPEDRTKKIRG